MVLGLALVIRAGLRDRGVITDHIEFGRRVFLGLELYAPYLEAGKPLHPPYPPSFGLLTGLLAWIPERLARFAWVIAQVACLFGLARIATAWIARHQPQLLARRHLVYLFVVLLCSRYLLRDTHGGGGNLINLYFLVQASAWAMDGRQRAGGLLLGLSLATKPTGILMLPLWALLGWRRGLSWAVGAGLGLVTLSLVLLRQGMAPFLRWFDGSLRYASMQDLFVEPAFGFPPFAWMNQCLRCAVARFCGTVPDSYASQVPQFGQGLGLAPEAYAWISRGLGLLLLLVTGLLIHRCRRLPAARLWSLAAVLSLSLLLSPISWKAHHVALMPFFFALGLRAMGPARPRWIWAFAALYLLTCQLGEALVTKEGKMIQQAWYLTTWGTLACLGIAWAQLRALARQAQAALPTAPPGA